MNAWKMTTRWLWMLTKRLYKKISFLVVLALIPLVAVGYGLADFSDSGILTIALAQEGQDPLATNVILELEAGSQLVRYVRCQSAEAARQQVQFGQADAAWIFPEQLQERITEFARDPVDENAFVTVLERQTNVATQLSREALSSALYGQLSRAYYLDYIRESVPTLSGLTDAQLLQYYDNVLAPETMFRFTDLSGNQADAAQNSHFLITPVRGLLAVVVVICAMAAGMYYIRDEKNGTFAWVPLRRQPLVEFACQWVSVFQLTLIAAVALAFLGLTGALWQELATVLVYSLCCAAFGMLLRRACAAVGTIGVLMPLLIVGMLLVCPVFIDVGELQPLQLLLPPTYYINAAADGTYLLYMGLYTLGLLAVYKLLGLLGRR